MPPAERAFRQEEIDCRQTGRAPRPSAGSTFDEDMRSGVEPALGVRDEIQVANQFRDARTLGHLAGAGLLAGGTPLPGWAGVLAYVSLSCCRRKALVQVRERHGAGQSGKRPASGNFGCRVQKSRPGRGASPPPTLMRLTPREASCVTVVQSLPTSTFTGLGATAWTTATMSAVVRMPGAYRQSAPASAYATSRRRSRRYRASDDVPLRRAVRSTAVGRPSSARREA